jgi:two-component system sensor histidine kinase/response regulator
VDTVNSRVPAGRERRPGWHLVSAQLVLALVITLLTAAAVISYDRMVRSSGEQQMQNTADLADVFLSEQNEGLGAVIASVAKASDVSTLLTAPDSAATRAGFARIIEVLRATDPYASTVAITDADGSIVADLPDRVPVGYDVSDRPWFKQVLSGGTFSVSAVFKSTITDSYLTTISVPIRAGDSQNGQLLGVVAIARTLNGYQDFVDSYAVSHRVNLSIVDNSGQLVATGGDSTVSGATLVRRLSLGRAVSGPVPGKISAGSKETNSRDSDGWWVVSQESEAAVMRPATLFRWVAVGILVLLLGGIFLAPLIRRRANRAQLEAERSLHQSQERMRDLANSSPDVLIRLTPDGAVQFSSKASETLLGVPAQELLGRNLAPLLLAETELDTTGRVRRLATTGEPQLFLARTTDAAGVRKIVECNLRLGEAEGEPEIWGSLRDVTDRSSARDQVEQLFQLCEDFMAVLDFQGQLVQTNPVWSAAFGLGAAELMGREFGELFEPEDRGRVANQLRRLTTDPDVGTFENRYLADDVIRTLLWTAAADPDRGLIYAVGRDITDHKELQQTLAETRDQALEASRLKSEFVATMSHEIRTPMNGVIGLTDLLLGTPLDATQRRYVEGVRTAGDALLSVINDILDFSKIEAGRLVLDSVDFRLEDVVDDVVTLVRPAASVKGLELTVDYDTGVPFALNGDPGRLRQILLNLAHNAVKFTDEGGISVRVMPGRTDPDGRVQVRFSVTDTGIGIDQARLEELFEPFRQADEGATRSYGGTGLGLSICRRLADLMGGSISATSELGHGATFVTDLIFSPAADWGRSVRGHDARGLAVLVVDDNEVNRLVMITQLNRWGMRPVAAASAAEAMELLTLRSAPAGGYDLAVIDMHMPETDGMALVRQIRSMPILTGLPVILLTSDQTVSPAAALDYGISARLTKPVQQSALFDALTRVAVPTSGPPSDLAAKDVESTQHQSEEPAGIGGFTLLLVEDNDINQTVALGILSQLGYQVDVAGDGLQAIMMCEQHDYDAILMDCQMPKLDGYAATVELRKRPNTRRTPIIAMTAATFAADRQRCFDSGMDDFIAKPVRAATLQAALNRWLRTDQQDQRAGAGAQPGDRQERDGHIERVRDEVSAAHGQVATVAEAGGRPAGEAVKPAVPAPRPVQQPEPSSIAGMQERITELLGDGSQLEVDLVRDIITSFLGRTVDLLQRLTLAVAADDSEAAYLHAHSLAGAGLNLGTADVVRISRRIEAEAKAGRPGQSVPRLIELEVALDRARVHLRDLAANLPDPDRVS